MSVIHIIKEFTHWLWLKYEWLECHCPLLHITQTCMDKHFKSFNDIDCRFEYQLKEDNVGCTILYNSLSSNVTSKKYIHRVTLQPFCQRIFKKYLWYMTLVFIMYAYSSSPSSSSLLMYYHVLWLVIHDEYQRNESGSRWRHFECLFNVWFDQVSLSLSLSLYPSQFITQYKYWIWKSQCGLFPTDV